MDYGCGYPHTSHGAHAMKGKGIFCDVGGPLQRRCNSFARQTGGAIWIGGGT